MPSHSCSPHAKLEKEPEARQKEVFRWNSVSLFWLRVFSPCWLHSVTKRSEQLALANAPDYQQRAEQAGLELVVSGVTYSLYPNKPIERPYLPDVVLLSGHDLYELAKERGLTVGNHVPLPLHRVSAKASEMLLDATNASRQAMNAFVDLAIALHPWEESFAVALRHKASRAPSLEQRLTAMHQLIRFYPRSAQRRMMLSEQLASKHEDQRILAAMHARGRKLPGREWASVLAKVTPSAWSRVVRTQKDQKLLYELCALIVSRCPPDVARDVLADGAWGPSADEARQKVHARLNHDRLSGGLSIVGAAEGGDLAIVAESGQLSTVADHESENSTDQNSTK